MEVGQLKYEHMLKPLDSGDEDIEEDDDDLSEIKRLKCEDDESKAKVQDQIDRRREQNRVLARRTRQRKKNYFESLQKQAEELLKENELLKGVVKAQANEGKQAGGSSYKPSTSAVQVNAASLGQTISVLNTDDKRLLAIVQASQQAFCITNPGLPDNPIVYVNKKYQDITGYKANQLVGKNCRMLQGPGTDKRQVESLRKGISLGRDTSVVMLNYRANGTSFNNQIFVAPLRDIKDVIVNYVGVIVEIELDDVQEVKYSQHEKLCDFLMEHQQQSPLKVTSKSSRLSSPALRPSIYIPPPPPPVPSVQSLSESLENDVEILSDDDLSFDFDDFLQNS